MRRIDPSRNWCLLSTVANIKGVTCERPDVIRALAILIFSCATTPPALAQSYPAKPLKVIVSTSAGGITDLAARIFGAHVTAKSGQPVVIENRPGASGNIAMDAVAKATPDGYTLGVANTGNIVINPYLMRYMPYDPLNDLLPVAPIGTVPLFLVINANLPAVTLAEFIAYAKAQPDKVSYASAGVGTTPDLAAHELSRRAGLKLVFVPFRGTAPAVAAVLGGDVQVTFVSMGPHMEFVRQGKLRVLAAATPMRVPYLPHVPTFAEQGFAGFEISTWFALFAPRATAKEIVDQLSGYVRDLARDADAHKVLAANFVDPAIMTAAEFADLVRADAVKWKQIVHDAGVTVD
jgi:tripartite-type tricarboxylate transporter receptor subunit TctC